LLLIDTNILVRCCQGKASRHVDALRERNIDLATTAHNVDELIERLANKFLLTADAVDRRVRIVLDPIEIVGSEQYSHLRDAAATRLRQGGKSDWPALAAALALDGQIWSEDVDFFGVGVPVWSTANIQYFGADHG
jgi:predicted nucleic acid-binding protein